jgi:hypothetical protein
LWEWRIRDARDVVEVIAWAEEDRGERTFQLFVEESMFGHPETDRVRLIRLAGSDPTRADEPAAGMRFVAE